MSRPLVLTTKCRCISEVMRSRSWWDWRSLLYECMTIGWARWPEKSWSGSHGTDNRLQYVVGWGVSGRIGRNNFILLYTRSLPRKRPLIHIIKSHKRCWKSDLSDFRRFCTKVSFLADFFTSDFRQTSASLKNKMPTEKVNKAERLRSGYEI